MEIFPVIILLAMAGVLIYAVGEAIEVLRSIDSGLDVLNGELDELLNDVKCLLDEVEEVHRLLEAQVIFLRDIAIDVNDAVSK